MKPKLNFNVSLIENRLEGIFKWQIDNFGNKTLDKYSISRIIDNNENEMEFYVGRFTSLNSTP